MLLAAMLLAVFQARAQGSWTVEYPSSPSVFNSPGTNLGTLSSSIVPPLDGGTAYLFNSSPAGSWEVSIAPVSGFPAPPHLIGKPSGGPSVAASEYGVNGFSGKSRFFFVVPLMFSANAGESATWELLMGSGNTFSPGTASVDNDDLFAGLRFLYDNAGTVSVKALEGSDWNDSGIPVESGTPYTLRVYGNNDGVAYRYEGPDGEVYLLAAGKYHVWLGNNYYGSFQAAGLVSGNVIDSWEFRGYGNAGSDNSLLLSFVSYGNTVLNELPYLETSVSALKTLCAADVGLPTETFAYDLAGSALSGSVSVSVSVTDFQISDNGSFWTNALLLTPDGDGKVNQTIYVRGIGAASQDASDVVFHASTGADNLELAVASHVNKNFGVPGPPWTQNFGKCDIDFLGPGISTTLVAQPLTGGGAASVYVPSSGGEWTIAPQPTVSIGEFSLLRGEAGGAEPVKFSTRGYEPGKEFYSKFDLAIAAQGGGTGKWYFLQGTGNSFLPDDESFDPNEVFAGLRWVFDGTQFASLQYLNQNDWENIVTIPFGPVFGSTLEVFSNNRSYPITYEHSTGNKRTLPAGTWDLWMDDAYMGNYAPGLLPAGQNMNSFEFRGQDNAVGSLELFLDNLVYSNVIPNQEYVDSVIFVNNRWQSQTEIDNFSDPVFSGLYPFAIVYGVNAFDDFATAVGVAESGATIYAMGKESPSDHEGEYFVEGSTIFASVDVIGTDASGSPTPNPDLMPVLRSSTADHAILLASGVGTVTIQNLKFKDYPVSVIEVEDGAMPSSALVRACIFENVGEDGGGAVVDLTNASNAVVLSNQFSMPYSNTDVVRVGADLTGMVSSYVSNIVVTGNQILLGNGTNVTAVAVVAYGSGDTAIVSNVDVTENTILGVAGTGVLVKDFLEANTSWVRNVNVSGNTLNFSTYISDLGGVIVFDNVSAGNGGDQNRIAGNEIFALDPQTAAYGILLTGAKTDNVVIENNDVTGSNQSNNEASIRINPLLPPSAGDILIRNNNLVGSERALRTGSLPANTVVNLQDNNLQTKDDGVKIQNDPDGDGNIVSVCDYWGVTGVPNPASDVIGAMKIITYKLSDADLDPQAGFQGASDCKAFINDLQDIVNVSNPGDTIFLNDDEVYYIGSTVLDKPITIIGGEGSVLVPDPDFEPIENTFDPSNPITYLDDENFDFVHGVIIASSDVTLKDVVINGDPNDELDCKYRFGVGVITDYSHPELYEQIKLENVKVENIYGTGIMIYNAGENNVVQNSYVANACLRADGIFFEYAYGIYSNAPSSTIKDNTVEYVGTGVKLDGEATRNGLEFEGNVLKYLEAYGVIIDALLDGGQVVVEGNEIEGVGKAGIVLFNLPSGSQIGSADKPNVIKVDSDNENLFFGEGKGVGLEVAKSEGVTVENNTIETSGKESGMWMVNNGTEDDPVVLKDNNFVSTEKDPTLTYDNLGQGTGIFISDKGEYLGGDDGDNYAVLEKNEFSGFTWGIYSNGTDTDGEIETTIGGDDPEKSNDFHDNRVGVVVNGSLANIRNNRTTFANNDTAVYVRGGNANIAANTFTDNTSTGIVVDNHGADQGQATIGGNSADDSNDISGSETGVVVRNGSLANIRNNRTTFSGNGVGIRVEMDAYAEIAGNTFTANSGSGVVVDNFAMIDLGGDDDSASNTITGSETGVVVRNGSLANIRNNRTTFANNNTGIQIEGNAVAIVTGNTFSDNSGSGIVTDGSELILGGGDDSQSNTITGSDNGVVVRNGSLANIRNNRTTFANNNNGVVVQSGSEVNMEGNTFSNNAVAGVVADGAGTEITIGGNDDSGSNTITGSETGVVVRNGSLANIRNNRTTFANNNTGVSIESGANASMEGNVFTSNSSAGVVVDGAGSQVTIGGADDSGSNTITDSDYGVVVRNGSLANIRNNRTTFAENGFGVLVQNAQANMTGNVFTDNTGAGVVVEDGATVNIGGTTDGESNTVTGSDVGVVVRNGSLANIRNNRTTFANNNTGVRVDGAATVNMSGNVFTDNALTGVEVAGAGTNVTIGSDDDSGSNTITGSETGVVVRNGSLANIRNNRTTFANNGVGVQVESGAQAAMEGNVFTNNNQAGVVVDAGNVTIGGNDDSGSNTITGSNVGVVVRNGSLANIRNNRTTFANNNVGVQIEGGSTATMEGNVFSNNANTGVVVEGEGTNVTIGAADDSGSNTISGSETGVVVRNGSLANIRNNRTTFANNTNGIVVEGAQATMTGNVITGNTNAGVVIQGDGNNLTLVTIGGDTDAESNTVSGSETGVVVRNGSLANIRNNRTTFANNTNGIVVEGASEVYIEGNTLSGNANAGIIADGAGTNVTIGGDGLFSSNTINDGDVGVVVRNGSLANIRNNRTTFAYCNVGVQIEGGATATMSGNTMNNNTQYGVLVDGAGTNVIIGGDEPGASNTVAGSEVGVVVRNGSLANIRNNRTTFSNNNVGIQIAGAEAFVKGNVIDANMVAGIQLTDDDDNEPGTANVYENFIGDQPVDLQNLSANPANQIRAEFNWWGDSNGTILGEIEQGVGAVDFSPWYREDVDSEPGDEGWGGNRSLLCIGSFSPDVDGTGKFQEGIDSLIAGGTLFVVNGGIFLETAVVNKDLTFINNGDPVLGALEINNPGGEVYMFGNFQVYDTLRMAGGILYLEESDVIIQCGGKIDPVNPASYVVTLENAKLSMECLGDGGETDPVTFPLGTAEGPTPLTLKNNGPSDYISVSAMETLRGNVATGTEFATDAVKVTWVIEEEVAGGSNFEMTAGFTAASELTDFDRNASAIYTYFDGGWNQIQTHGPADGSGIFTRTATGVTSVGAFSIQDSLRSCRPDLIVAAKAVTCDGPSSGRVTATVRFAPGQNFPVQFRLFGPVYRGWQSTGVFNNVPPGAYKVQVRRLNDQSCFVERAVVVNGLQTPIITFINNITTNSARISWNGDPANRYEIEYRQLGSMTWTSLANLSGSVFTLTGLMPSTRYEVRLRILCPDASATAFTAIRIFQTAGGGKVESDEAKEVREELEAAEKEIFSVYPNPTDGPVTLLFGLPEARKVHFVITDLNGRVIAEDSFMGNEGVNRSIIDMSRHASGLYVMKFSDGFHVRTAYIQVK